MAATYDAIVVGGGHNGLVAAAYLARSGARTIVLEGRHKTGGAATTEAPWPEAPEFKVTRLSYVMSLMPPTIISDLGLPGYGYHIYPMGPYYQAFPEGGSIKLYAADPGTHLQEHHTGSVEMAPTVEYIERAFQDSREGRPALRPFSDGVIPTALDKSLIPEGYHIMSLFSQWVPSDWNTEPHTEELEAYADRQIDCYNELAPNFKSSILHRDIVGPYQMEHEYGLIGGNIFHGELSLEQLFHMRPAPGFADYRTPASGLYYGSSATHAGGGVCGIPGWQAARAAIADKKASRRAGQLRTFTRRS